MYDESTNVFICSTSIYTGWDFRADCTNFTVRFLIFTVLCNYKPISFFDNEMSH